MATLFGILFAVYGDLLTFFISFVALNTVDTVISLIK